MQREYFSSFESSSNDDSVIESVDNKVKTRNKLESKNFNLSKYNQMYILSKPKIAFKTNCDSTAKTENSYIISKGNKSSSWMLMYTKLFKSNKEKSFSEIFLRFHKIVYCNRGTSDKLFEEDLISEDKGSSENKFVRYLLNAVQYKDNFLKTNKNYHLLENIKKLMTNKQNNSFESLQVDSNNKSETKFKFKNSIKNDCSKSRLKPKYKNKEGGTKTQDKNETTETSKIKKLFSRIEKLKVMTTRNTKESNSLDVFPTLSINNTPSNRQNTKETELRSLNPLSTKETDYRSLNHISTNKSSEQFNKISTIDFSKNFDEKPENQDNKNKLEILFFQKLLNSKVSKIKQSSRFLNEILFDIVKQEYEKTSFNTVYQDTVNKFLYSSSTGSRECK